MTPSVVVRVNRWVALPTLAVPPLLVLSPVASGVAGIIGQAIVPEPAEPEAAAPPPDGGEEGDAEDSGVALATLASPDCLVGEDDNAPVVVNPMPTAPAATATAVADASPG